jgi:NAD-dependent DNA ligase
MSAEKSSPINPNQAARLLIMSAYLYYRCDSPVISDADYDKLSLYVSKNWDKLDEQLQWQLNDPESIKATGSGIIITQMGQGAAHHWHKKKKKKDIDFYPLKWYNKHPKYKCLYAII